MYARPVKHAIVVGVIIGWTAFVAGRDARADELKPFAGKLVISPDAPPTESSELPKYLKANLTTDGSYPIVKGPPWSVHIVGVLAKDAKQVTLVVTEKVDKPGKPAKDATPSDKPAAATPLVSIELVPKRRVVMAHTDATVAAGFANGKTYAVKLLGSDGKTVLAKCELVLRD